MFNVMAVSVMPTKMRFMDFFQRVSSAAVSWDGNFGAVLLSVDSHVFVMFFCSRSAISSTSLYFLLRHSLSLLIV